MSEELSFGLELVVSAHAPFLSRKADALTCLVHWKLLTEGCLRCVGTGEVFSVSSATNEHPPSEILRKEAFFKSGGSSSSEGVAIKYRGLGDQKTSKYLLKLHELDENTLLLNIIRISDEKVITLKFNPHKIICDSFKSTSDLGNVFVDAKELTRQIEKEVIEILFPKPVPESRNPAPKVDRGTTSTYEPRLPHPFPGHMPHIPMRPFPDIVGDPTGRGDLEPFSTDGGGMLMDPFGGSRRRDPGFPNFDPPMPGMRNHRRGFP